MSSLDLQRTQQSRSYSVLSDYLSNKQEPDAAQASFCEPVETQWYQTKNEDDVEEKLHGLWRDILSKAAVTSFQDQDRSRLADFVVQLQNRADLTKDDQVCKVQDMTVWRDLPLFGQQVRDCWNTPAEDKSDAQAKAHWINVNAFTASLLSLDSADRLGLALFGLWTARMALEESSAVADVTVAAAAAWFVFAGPSMARFSQQSKSFDGRIARPGSEFSDKEWRGFTPDRWTAWQDKFASLQAKVSHETAKELIAEARKVMADAY